MDLGARKILAGFGWIALINYSNRIFGFITTLILAKLLSPNDFGLVAIASMIISVLQIFKDMGLSEALIFRKDEIEKASNTAFILMISLNSLIFLIAVVASPIASKYYDNHLVMPVIILMSSNLVWNSIASVPYTLIRKKLDFNRLVVPSLIPVLISSVVSIAMAYTGFGVWSLVAKTILATILNMILILRITHFRPSFRFDLKIARDLFHYGQFIIGTSILLVALYNIDRFYISTFVGIAAVGMFELAMSIANQSIVELSHLVGSVMFPALSKLNQDMQLFKKTFLKTMRYASTLTIPLAIGIFTFGPSLIKNLYGDVWEPMADPLQILSIYALFRSLSAIIYDGYKAIGRPNLMQSFTMVRLASIGLIGIPAIKLYGVNGLCILIVVTYGIVFFFEMMTLCKMISINVIQMMKELLFISIISSSLIWGVYKGLNIMVVSANLLQNMLGIGLIIIIYVTITLILNRTMMEEVKDIFKKKKKVNYPY